MIIDMLDETIAQELNVPVGRFIEVIENTSMMRAEAVIFGILSGDDDKMSQARRIFKLMIEMESL